MNHSNRNLMPGTSNINKWKYEFDAVGYKPPLPSKIPKSSGFKKPGCFKPPPPSQPVSNQPTSLAKPPSTSNKNNLLLAGYLAHEFLTKGTLFGEQLDPARAETGPSNSKQTMISSKAEPNVKAAELKSSSSRDNKRDRYVEVACLLKTDGAHISGVVNPTQLGRILHM